jgi:hypothetical protein
MTKLHGPSSHQSGGTLTSGKIPARFEEEFLVVNGKQLANIKLAISLDFSAIHGRIDQGFRDRFCRDFKQGFPLANSAGRDRVEQAWCGVNEVNPHGQTASFRRG